MLGFQRVMFYAAVAMVLIIGLAYPAAAQRWDKKTTITINVPVRVGNVVLPAGTYVMRLHDDPGVRRLVQIWSADERKLYTTTFGLPDFRMETTDQTAITFYEADPGRSPALRTWFYPASQFGLEFIDSRGPVQQVASNVEPEPVPAEPEPEPVSTPAEVQPAPEPEPAPAPEPVAEVAANEPPPAPQAEPAPVELPKTAGDLPLLALTGLLSMGASLWLKRFI